MNDSVIEANQVTKKYRSVLALDGVSLRVSPGSIYGLIGDNGAGKSTFLKILARPGKGSFAAAAAGWAS